MPGNEESSPSSFQVQRQIRLQSIFGVFKHSHTDKAVLPTSIQSELTNTKNAYVSETLNRLRSGETLSTVCRRRLLAWEEPRFCRLDKDFLYFRYSRAGYGCKTIFGKNQEKKVDLRSIRVLPGVQEKSVIGQRKAKTCNYFSIVFENSSRLPLSFVTPCDRSAKDWVLCLNHLKKQITDLRPRLQFELSAWELFNATNLHKEGQVSLRSARQSLLRDGYNIPIEILRKYSGLKSPALHHHRLAFETFFDLYQDVSSQPNINKIFEEISPDKTVLTIRELYKFLQEKQGEDDVTEKDCEDIINNYELDDEARSNKQMTKFGFNLFLTSPRCEIFNWRHNQVYQDMNQPLSHYYVASSHNTYLTGDQITEPSSVDAYMNVLLKGCRCVELDCWDGPDGEPLIYHGYTLTSKLKFKDVVEVIGRYAFEASEYPLILSLENHCSISQQDKMAFYMKTILGSELLTTSIIPEEKAFALPSPSALRGKIILKGKTLWNRKSNLETKLGEERKEEDYVSDNEKSSSDANNAPQNDKLSRKSSSKWSFKRDKSNSSFHSTTSTSSSSTVSSWNVSPRLSDLIVYCKSIKFISLDDPNKHVVEISSFAEGKFKKLLKNGNDKLVEYHKHYLSRTYPSGSRTDSSNYDPQPLWKAGFQLVALNYQTQCDEMDVYQGWFRQNGGCGYVLKPTFQRLPQDSHEIDITTRYVKISILSGPHRHLNNSRNCLLEIIVSGDRCDNTKCSIACLAADGLENSETSFPIFSHVIRQPQLAIVRFILKDTSRLRERVGQYTLPFTSIAQGYRHIPFMGGDGTTVTGTSVFVHIFIDDATIKLSDSS